jgi:ribosomal protein S18 acetylase RimI-like enzyme
VLNGDYVFDEFPRYPAILHINILEKFQRRGVGGALFAQMNAYLNRKHATGVQLQTTTGNEKMFHFLAKQGFTELARKKSIFYEKYDIKGIENVVFGKRIKPLLKAPAKPARS